MDQFLTLKKATIVSGPSRGYYLIQVCFLAFLWWFPATLCTLSYHFVCFFGEQLSSNFLK